MEDAKKRAAEKRRQLTIRDTRGDEMLATVQAIKISRHNSSTAKIEEKKVHYSSGWRQPVDWRLVNEGTLYKYIPFQEPNINQAKAIQYIKEQLLQYPKPSRKIVDPTKDTPLWYLSNNQLKRAVYRAAVTQAMKEDRTGEVFDIGCDEISPGVKSGGGL